MAEPGETKATRTVLITANFVTAAPAQAEERDDYLNAFTERLRACLSAFIAAEPSVEESGGFSFFYLDDPDDPEANAGRCASCHRWTTDIEKPEVLHGLLYG